MLTQSLRPLVVAACVLLLAGSLLPSATAVAVPPSQAAPLTVPYAGRLADAAGTAVPDGLYSFRFTLYADVEGGDPLWSETQESVPVTGGEFATTLGNIVPLPAELPNGGKVWLLVAVRGASEADFTDLLPRQPVAVEAKDDDVTASAVDAATCPHTHWHELWSGNNTTYGLQIDNNGTGDGLRAYSSATAANYAAIYGTIQGAGAGTGVYGRSTNGYGVYGSSTNKPGVYGLSSNLDGVMGEADTFLKSGVYGFHSADGYGVFGRSANRFGMGAAGAGDDTADDEFGDILLAGERGEIVTTGRYFNVYTEFDFNVNLDDNNNDANACFNIRNGADAVIGQTCENGAKSAVLQTESNGSRAVYSMESPEVWLEDFGSATLNAGVAVVTIDPVFAEMINTTLDYHVFVTPLGDSNGLYVAEKGATGFTVKEQGGGVSNISFDYRIVAKRLGLEELRMEVVDAAGASQ